MKGLLIILGIILLAGAVYGFATVGNTGLPESAVDAAVDAAGAAGLTQSLGFVDQVKVFLVDNRIILAIVGLISLLAGLFIKRSGRA